MFDAITFSFLPTGKYKKTKENIYMSRKKRKRENLQRFYLSDFELENLEQSMQLLGIDNKSDYFREMVLKGKKIVIDFDYSNMGKLIYELNRIGNNVNQIAKITNEKRNIFHPEILELQNLVSEANKIVAEEFKRVIAEIDEVNGPSFKELFEK